jgi:hypothetical protein
LVRRWDRFVFQRRLLHAIKNSHDYRLGRGPVSLDEELS